MKPSLRYAIITALVVLSILLQPWQPSPRHASATARTPRDLSRPAQSAGGGTKVYLPVVTRPPGPPIFEIISPQGGWTVSGMLYFAVQPAVPATVV